MMHPPASPPNVTSRPPVILTYLYDLLTPKLTVSCPCTVDYLCQFAAIWVHSFVKYRVHKIRNGRTDGQTDKRTDERTQAENIVSGQSRLAEL